MLKIAFNFRLWHNFQSTLSLHCPVVWMPFYFHFVMFIVVITLAFFLLFYFNGMLISLFCIHFWCHLFHRLDDFQNRKYRFYQQKIFSNWNWRMCMEIYCKIWTWIILYKRETEMLSHVLAYLLTQYTHAQMSAFFLFLLICLFVHIHYVHSLTLSLSIIISINALGKMLS